MSSAGKQSENDEEEDLLNLLDGDDFITPEERRRRDAEKRRMERKRRLESMEQEPEVKPPPPQPSSSSSLVNEKNTGLAFSSNLPPSFSKPVSGARGENGHAQIKTEEDEDDDDDGFDMFSSSVSPVAANTSQKETTAAAGATNNAADGGTQQDFDDAEGYYKAVIGEIIALDTSKNEDSETNSTSKEGTGDISFRVSGVIGKGVFSSVLKATTISNTTATEIPPTVAIKCIRHNETMAKTAFLEIQYLQRLNGSRGIVPLLLPTSTTPLEHRGHILMVFPCAEHNLREVLQKFGRGVGLSLEAVRSYFGQLLAAASHLKKHHLIHSDLKPGKSSTVGKTALF